MFHHDTFKLQNHKKGFLISHLKSYFKNRNWTCVVSTHMWLINSTSVAREVSPWTSCSLAGTWSDWEPLWWHSMWSEEGKMWNKSRKSDPDCPHLVVWLSCRFHCVTGQIIKSHDVPQHADCLVERTISRNILSVNIYSQISVSQYHLSYEL